MNAGNAFHRTGRRALHTLLPARDPHLARLHRGVAGLRARHSCWHRLLVPMSPEIAALHDAGAEANITVDCRHGRLSVRVGSAFPALLACSRIDDATTRDAVASMLTAQALPHWLSVAATDSQWRVRAEPVHDGAPRPTFPLALRLGMSDTEHDWEHDGNAFAFIIDANPTLLSAIEAAARSGHLELPARLSLLRLPGRLVLERRDISVGGLRRLRRGDILLTRFAVATTIAAAIADTELPLIWGTPELAHLRARVLLETDCVTLLTSPELAADILDNAETAVTPMWNDDQIALDIPAEALTEAPIPEPRGMLSDLEKLQVPLLVALDAPALTLAELAALEPGVSIELPERPESACVSISVHGQLLALGRLVVVGERLGVEITRLDRKSNGAEA